MIIKDFNKINTLLVLCKLIVKLISLIHPSKSELYTEFVQSWFNQFSTNVKSQGLPQALKIAKEQRLIFLRKLSGSPMTVSNILRVGIKNGFPRLVNLEKMDLNSFWDLRLILTILNVSRCFHTPPNPDFAPLTEYYKGPLQDVNEAVSFREILSAVRTLVRDPKLRKLDVTFKEFHLSNKSSPMGIPAMLSSLFEAKALVNIYRNVYEALGVFAGESLKTKILSVSMCTEETEVRPKCPPKHEGILRRISAIPDKEGKTRLICLLDYWSQTALLPLHDSFMRILKQIPSDMTYNQSKIPLDMISGYVSSCDLTNATDRFPVSLQRRILECFIGEAKAKAWLEILTSIPFAFQGKNYTFGVGQPLGAYSSWAVFTFCHHVVVRLAIRRAHCEVTTRPIYRILGDDIVIFDRKVAIEYQKILGDLGVEVSLSKTFVSDNFFELAKRQFIKRDGIWTEITGFPLAGLIQSVKIPYLASQYFTGIINKGWQELESVLMSPDTIKSFVKSAGGKPTNSYLKDFTLSLFSVTNLEQAEKFANKFPGLNPYCNNKERYKNLILDAFIIARLRLINKDLKTLSSIEIGNKVAQMRDDIDSRFSPIKSGKDVPSSIQESILSTCLPYISIWQTQNLKFNELRRTYLSAIEYGDDLRKAIFDDRSYVDVHSLPKMEVLQMTSRRQEEILKELRLIKVVLHEVLPHFHSKFVETFESAIRDAMSHKMAFRRNLRRF